MHSRLLVGRSVRDHERAKTSIPIRRGRTATVEVDRLLLQRGLTVVPCHVVVCHVVLALHLLLTWRDVDQKKI